MHTRLEIRDGWIQFHIILVRRFIKWLVGTKLSGNGCFLTLEFEEWVINSQQILYEDWTIDSKVMNEIYLASESLKAKKIFLIPCTRAFLMC